LKKGQTSKKGSTRTITHSEGLFQLQNCGEKSFGSLWSWKPGVNLNHQLFVFQKASPFFHLCISFSYVLNALAFGNIRQNKKVVAEIDFRIVFTSTDTFATSPSTGTGKISEEEFQSNDEIGFK